MYFSGTDIEQRKEASQTINIKKPHGGTTQKCHNFFMSEPRENMHQSVPVSTSIFWGKQDAPEQLDVHKQH